MLGSLLKYDFRALNKVMLPLQLGVLVAGILGTVCANISYRSIRASLDSYSYYSSSYASQSVVDSFVQTITLLTSILLFSAVFISSFITLVLLARNIYKNFYSSEGYLTFTLPVTVDQHLLSKTISGLTWLLVNALIVIVSVMLLIIFGFANQGLVNVDVIKGLGELFSELLTPLGIIYLIELLFIGLVSLIMSIYQIMVSIILGGSAARTHKVLAAIGIYIGIGTVVSILTSTFSFFTFVATNMFSSGSAYSSVSWFTESQPTLIITGVLSIILVVVFHLISRISLKKSLNLE